MAQGTSAGTAAEVAHAYFAALTAHDLDAAVACWSPGGIDRVAGNRDLVAPDGVREYFGELFRAFPDFAFEVVSQTSEEERCAVSWRATATFAGPGSFQGIEPNGARVELEGCDVLQVHDGRIHHNVAYLDGLSVARQLGLLPQRDSSGERRLNSVFNARTRVGRNLMVTEPEEVGEGVWVIRGGLPAKTMNVYLLADDGGVALFDAGIKAMTRGVAAATARMGGVTRVVLGHSHPDQRGAAPGLGAPVYCHPDEVADAQGDGGLHYADFSKLDFPARLLMPRMLSHWDGGPVDIAGTLSEGDDVAGFNVVHLPGHAPGLIGLWRASDGLILSSDCFFVLDPQTGRHGHPRVPPDAFNFDTEQARASIRKVAELEPAAAWPGHGEPLVGDVRGQLEQAAATT